MFAFTRLRHRRPAYHPGRFVPRFVPMNIRREIGVVNSMEVAMPNLSEAAVALFRLHIERMGQLEVDETNRDAYRELERAELVLLGRPFVGEPRYHLTRAGYDLKGELGACAKQSA